MEMMEVSPMGRMNQSLGRRLETAPQGNWS